MPATNKRFDTSWNVCDSIGSNVGKVSTCKSADFVEMDFDKTKQMAKLMSLQ